MQSRSPRRRARRASAACSRYLPALCLPALLVFPARATPVQESDSQQPTRSAATAPAIREVPGYAGDLVVTWAEFDRLLLDRYALAPEGESAVLFLCRSRLLEELGAESGISIGPEDLVAEIQRIARRLVEETGESLTEILASSGVSRDTFEATVRRSMLQERLARAALGIPADRPVPADSQSLWLDSQVRERGVERYPRPFPPEGLARLGAETWIGEAELAELLRTQVSASAQREALAQMLLQKALELRLAGRPKTELEAAVDREIAVRRAEAKADPSYKGVPFEDLLSARGRSLEGLRRDPAVRVAAYATDVVQKEVPEERLRAVYQADQSAFDARIGPAVRGRVLFLAAGDPASGAARTPEAARTEIEALAKRAASEAAFGALCQQHSQDQLTRGRGGDLGFVTREQEGVLPEVAEALFAAAERGLQGLLPPLPLPQGMALLWLSEKRPTPPFEELRPRIRKELERRLLETLLPAGAIHTYVDDQLRAEAPSSR